jgi:hypothetical protein
MATKMNYKVAVLRTDNTVEYLGVKQFNASDPWPEMVLVEGRDLEMFAMREDQAGYANIKDAASLQEELRYNEHQGRCYCDSWETCDAY